MQKAKNRDKDNSGFSITEAIVVIALITAISAVVLVNFGGLNQGVALSRAAREMALNFRRAQNMALAVTYVSAGGAPSDVHPAIGINFKTSSPSELTKYRMFADVDPSAGNPPPTNNRFFDGASEIMGNDILFERGIRIQEVKVFPADSTPPEVNILFFAPEAVVAITNSGGSSFPDWQRVEITLITQTGQTKKVIVRDSGQISVR